MSGMHDGHRDRVRDTFLQTGMDAMPPHNVLEMLLFYSVPRKDTNEMAHELIDRFGSIDKVFDADYEQLINVPGVTKNTAVLLKMVPQLARYYMVHKTHHGEELSSVEKVGKYFVPLFVGETCEVLYVVFLDNKLQVVSCKKLSSGTQDSVDLQIDRIIREAANSKAKRVIIAHNHPDGNPNPSSEDISLTIRLKKSLQLIDKELVDHIVVGDNDFISLVEIGILSAR